MIAFEDKLIPIKNLTAAEELPFQLACIVNTKQSLNTKPLVSQISGLNIPYIPMNPTIIRKLRATIFSDNKRFCKGLGGFETTQFCRDEFMMIISYFEYEGKNYINGFINVKVFNKDSVEISYICSDLHFSGIGKILLSLVKLVITMMGIQTIRLESVLNPSTQNFYTSQGFQYVKDEGDKKIFEINTGLMSRKDQLSIGRLFHHLGKGKPLLATYHHTKNRGMDTMEILPYLEIRTRRSPQPSPRNFFTPQSSPRSARSTEDDSIFRDVASPRSTAARGRKKMRDTKKRRKKKN
jgi:hypothetical protein